MTILDAIRDPKLFGRWFEAATWRRWFVALAAMFAHPPGSLEALGVSAEEALEVYRHHTGRQTWPTVPCLEFFGLCGRRGGKSLVMGLVGSYLAAFRKYKLALGERGVVMLVAADKKQARVLRRYIGAFFQHIPMLRAMVVRETAEAIDLNNGVSIEIHVASYRSTRGYTCVAVICDEICFWHNDAESANPDSEVLAALRPAMATVPGALLMIISSPYAKRGEAWNAFRRYFGQDGAGVLVWRAATREMNPGVPQHVIDRAYADDEESARSEYGAEWRDDITTFLDRQQIETLVELGVAARPRSGRFRYVAHCDPSGGRSDSMTLAIGHEEGDRVVLDFLAERQPPFDPDIVVNEFANLLGAYGVRNVQVDAYGAEWVPSAFRRVGVHAEAAESTTSDHYRAMLPLVTTGRLQLLDVPRLINQMAALERRISRGGRELIGHPPGGHDDCAASVAGICALLSRDKRVVLAYGHLSALHL